MNHNIFYFMALGSVCVLMTSCNEPTDKISFDHPSVTEKQENERTIENSLSSGTFYDDFKDHPYEVISYALLLQSSYPYSLTMMDGIAKSSTMGISVNQNIRSANYYTPKQNFNQNISSSSFVKTADRFYDNKDGTILAYNGKESSDWPTMSLTKQYSYDEYIQAYGKLIKSVYYCSTNQKDDDVVPEVYLSDKKDVYDASMVAGKHVVNAVSMYDFSTESILSGNLEKTDSGYQLSLKLDPDRSTVYSKIQMKKTGGLSAYPEFSSVEAVYQLDEGLSLVSSDTMEKYHAKMGIISTNIEMRSHFTYLHSQDGTFERGEKKRKVEVPSMTDVTFVGYELLDD